jgi:hypothetical protein
VDIAVPILHSEIDIEYYEKSLQLELVLCGVHTRVPIPSRLQSFITLHQHGCLAHSEKMNQHLPESFRQLVYGSRAPKAPGIADLDQDGGAENTEGLDERRIERAMILKIDH